MNLLNMALTVIAPQAVEYYANTGRTTNAIGIDVAAYAAPVPMRGSLQPVPRTLYQANGLDYEKNYYTFYTPNNVLDVRRDVSGDQITYNGMRLQVLASNDWFPQDGWVGVLCVQVPGV
jgi:hypothetical protein